MNNTIKAIQTGKNFLALCFANENRLPTFDFKLNTNETFEVKVSVVDTGIITFEPKNNESSNVKSIVISCGVHGNETAPIEIVNDLVKQLLSGAISLKHRVMFVVGNISAIKQNKRYITDNLNNIFCCSFSKKQVSESYEKKRVKVLESAVRDFYSDEVSSNKNRYHYDLHTSIRASDYEWFAIHPYSANAKVDKSQLCFLKSIEVNTVLFANAPANTFSYFSSKEFNALGFTIELGQVKPIGTNKLSEFTPTYKALTELLSEDDIDYGAFHASDYNLFTMNQRIYKQSEHLMFNFSDEVKNFNTFTKGTLLATDGDISYYAQVEGEAILFPNMHVPIGNRALLTVVPITSL